MARRLLIVPAIVVVAAVAAATGLSRAEGGSAAAGDLRRGAVLYVSSGCGACHVFRAAGSTGTAGPDLDRWPATHAARLRLPLAAFVVGRIAYGGTGMPAATGQLSAAEIDDLASFVLGEPTTTPEGGAALVPPLPATPPLVTAPAATVRAWVKTKGLIESAARGARVLAGAGCLSCHRYLGAGVRRAGAPDLGAGGPRRLDARRLRRLIADPAAMGSTAMPAYADLGDAGLRALADLLVASRR